MHLFRHTAGASLFNQSHLWLSPWSLSKLGLDMIFYTLRKVSFYDLRRFQKPSEGINMKHLKPQVHRTGIEPLTSGNDVPLRQLNPVIYKSMVI